MEKIEERYALAKKIYAQYGVDTDKALAEFAKIPVSLQCWTGDDIKGFEGVNDVINENVVTGSFPFQARNGDELRGDIAEAFTLSPLTHKVQLHSIYAEHQTERSLLTAKDFDRWIDWAKKSGVGLDINGTFFSSHMMDDGLSLSSPKKEIRDYWIKVGRSTRECALGIGKALGITCYNNLWIPDGMKDIAVSRAEFRDRLIDSLNKIYDKPYAKADEKYAKDVLEGKYFGIGSESFVVGSHEFYIAYAAKHNLGVTIDMGHFREGEDVSDKISAIYPFVNGVMLHVSRGIHWDSDHTVIETEALKNMMLELKRSGYLGKVAIGLDYFDATINRVYEWTIGLRATAKALLYALLEPTPILKKDESEHRYGDRLLLIEEENNLPFNDVWDYLLMQKGVKKGAAMEEELHRYEKEVQSLRQ
jgi:L-rhamnose isomerase